MGRTPLSGGTAFRFLPAEVADMEKALDASSGATPARSIVESLADKFSNSSERNGQKPVQWKQVWNWFQNRRHAQKAKIDKLKAVGSGAETPPAAKAVTVAGPSTTRKPSDVQMDFEAKSARDGAWYDVSAFISKRTSENGEPEVRVRFAGFGSEEDEWVNIATAVRQRSLPCETTECVAVLPGDLILCFQEGNEQALYFDADILDVQRRRHDVRGCRCRFWVRYRHDQTEEVVPLRKVCRRPETEQRLQLAREAAASSSKLANKEAAIEAATRALNETPNSNAAPRIPPSTPATPVTPVTPAAYNATHLPGTSPALYTPVHPGTASTPGLQPMQPVGQGALPPAAHPIGTLQGTTTPVHAIPSSQGPTQSSTHSQQPGPSSTSAQHQILPSIESSVAQQLNISAPAQQQTPPNSAVAEPGVSGATTQQQFIPDTAAVNPGASGPAEHQIPASTSNLEIVSGVKSTSTASSAQDKSSTRKESSTIVPGDQPSSSVPESAAAPVQKTDKN